MNYKPYFVKFKSVAIYKNTWNRNDSKDNNFELVSCSVVGFLIQETDETIVVCQAVNGDEAVGIMVIPKKQIIVMYPLRKDS